MYVSNNLLPVCLSISEQGNKRNQETQYYTHNKKKKLYLTRIFNSILTRNKSIMDLPT